MYDNFENGNFSVASLALELSYGLLGALKLGILTLHIYPLVADKKEYHLHLIIYIEVRRELYGQLFEEIIRQSLVSCKERGMLLLRVRNELKQTLLAYKELFLR